MSAISLFNRRLMLEDFLFVYRDELFTKTSHNAKRKLQFFIAT